MPYLMRNTGVRPLPVRGMGQSPCNWIQNLLCGSSAVQMVGGVPCSQCNALVPPTVPQQAPSLPAGYNPDTGQITTSTPAGDLSIPSMDIPYQPSYPSNVSAAAAGGGGGSCDWTQASWLDVSTWCGTNWLLAGIVVLGGAVLLKGAFK